MCKIYRATVWRSAIKIFVTIVAKAINHCNNIELEVDIAADKLFEIHSLKQKMQNETAYKLIYVT